MLTIGHNPTHIELAFPDGKAAPPEGKAFSEGRVSSERWAPSEGSTLSEGRGAQSEATDEVNQKNDRKNEGFTFAKLLAGLQNKKTSNNGEINQEGLVPPAASKDASEITAVTEAKGKKNSKEALFVNKDGFSAAKESRKKETGKNQGEFYPAAAVFAQMFPVDEKKNQNAAFEQVSYKSDQSLSLKDDLSRKIPFKKRDTPDTSTQSESQLISLKLKKEEKTFQTQNRSENNSGESKKSVRKKVSFEVYDQRTQTGTEAGTIAERGLKSALDIRNSTEKEITVELRPEYERGEKPAEAGQKIPVRDSFSEILARELRGDLSADIVRQASIVLRDGGEGIIRLSLKPETLGKVKIHLEMAENRITGHIFVQNEEALRAFQQEIHTLEEFFRDSGFEASLNAALDYRNEGQQRKEKEIEPFYSERFTATYEESGVTEFANGLELQAVNVLI